MQCTIRCHLLVRNGHADPTFRVAEEYQVRLELLTDRADRAAGGSTLPDDLGMRRAAQDELADKRALRLNAAGMRLR